MNNSNEYKDKLKPTYKTFLLDHRWHSKIIGFLVGILMIAIYIWIIFGFFDLLSGLYHSFFKTSWVEAVEHMMKSILILFALLEFIRVLQSYLQIGRVRVTFIIDVALVVLIGELMGFWYRKIVFDEVFLGGTVIALLVVLRIVTSKYSPDCNET